MKLNSAKEKIRTAVRNKIWEINVYICNQNPIPKNLKALANHFEKQFKVDMTWHNYTGVWEIEHIKPLALFDSVEELLEKANELSNLKPEYISINRQKLNFKK